MKGTYLTTKEASILHAIAHESKMDWFNLVWVGDSRYVIYDNDDQQVVPFFQGLEILDEGLDYEFLEEKVGNTLMQIYYNFYSRLQSMHDDDLIKKVLDK